MSILVRVQVPEPDLPPSNNPASRCKGLQLRHGSTETLGFAQDDRGETCFSSRMAKRSVKTGVQLPRENCAEAGADWFLIRAPVPGQGCLFGLRMSEVNPPARARLMQSKLLLRTDLVAVIPIDRWIRRRLVCNFGVVGLILLSLRALFFLHFALLDPLHFFLRLLNCRGRKPLLTAECAQGP